MFPSPKCKPTGWTSTLVRHQSLGKSWKISKYSIIFFVWHKLVQHTPSNSVCGLRLRLHPRLQLNEWLQKNLKFFSIVLPNDYNQHNIHFLTLYGSVSNINSICIISTPKTWSIRKFRRSFHSETYHEDDYKSSSNNDTYR